MHSYISPGRGVGPHLRMIQLSLNARCSAVHTLADSAWEQQLQGKITHVMPVANSLHLNALPQAVLA